MFWCGKENSLFIITLLTIVLVPIASSKRFRSDYVYNQKTDAFYKFHIEGVLIDRAKDICKIEGAQLIVPDSEEDVSQVHGMFKQYPDLEGFIWIAMDRKDLESADEQPIINYNSSENNFITPNWNRCDVMTRQGDVKSSGCFRELPFVCKVAALEASFDTRCTVYGKDYQYYENVGSCYKVPNIVYSWDQAYAECRAEGAHLVVLNSETEHQVVQNLTNSIPDMVRSRATWFFLAGIRAEKKSDGSPIVFKTIFNQTLEEAGYSKWSQNEPNNALGKEYCGTIFKNDGKYNDVDCSHLYGFVCEIEVKNT